MSTKERRLVLRLILTSLVREKPQQHRKTKVSKQEKAIEPKWHELMAYGLIKWVLRKQTGLNGFEKREETNP